jgi:hypothetical protein
MPYKIVHWVWLQPDIEYKRDLTLTEARNLCRELLPNCAFKESYYIYDQDSGEQMSVWSNDESLFVASMDLATTGEDRSVTVLAIPDEKEYHIMPGGFLSMEVLEKLKEARAKDKELNNHFEKKAYSEMMIPPDYFDTLRPDITNKISAARSEKIYQRMMGITKPKDTE